MGSGAARRWRAEVVGGSSARERAELLRATLSRRRSWGAAKAGAAKALGACCARAHVAHEDAVDVVRVCLGGHTRVQHTSTRVRPWGQRRETLQGCTAEATWSWLCPGAQRAD